jgi:hypothetical protein
MHTHYIFWLLTISFGGLQVDAFLDFDQNNAKSVVFTTDRSYQSGEQVSSQKPYVC